MNLARLMTAALRRVPKALKGPITFTNRQTGETATSTGVFVPASSSPSDTFQARETFREKARRGVVEAGPLGAFVPASGMTATWEGGTWSVAGASPLDPGGTGTAAQYRVGLTR
jgi:hypothetical protein